MEVFNYWLDDRNNDEKVKELELVRKFKSHGVIRERVELYKDFSINLINYIYDSYLGSDYIKTEHDIRGHFTWAYIKVLDEFYEEGIDFYDNEELYTYFYNFYRDQFYQSDEKKTLSNFEKFWNEIFEVKKNKPRSVFEVLLEIYEIFDLSFVRANSKEKVVF